MPVVPDEPVPALAVGRGRRYHHGDLRNALIVAAFAQARSGGPDAVVLREAARAAGVSATAAYRHFTGHDELLAAVREKCLAEFARWILSAAARATPLADPQAEAVHQLRCLGRSYVGFAIDEPGMFRTVFCGGTAQCSGGWARYPPGPVLARLTASLDALFGEVDPGSRRVAEVAAWAGVHGLAMLLLDGPLRDLSRMDRMAMVVRVVDGLIAGILGMHRV